jgi:hypothetical protein
MLWILSVILLVMWLLSISMHVGGSWIHAMLVLAIGISIFNLFSGRRSSAKFLD